MRVLAEYTPYYTFDYIEPYLLLGEIFKVIPTYCDYLASNYGRIWSIKSKIILKQNIRKRDGYLDVKLAINGRTKTITVHQFYMGRHLVYVVKIIIHLYYLQYK